MKLGRLGLLVAFFFVGCGDGGTIGNTGSLGAACSSNGTCDTGLICLDEVCVEGPVAQMGEDGGPCYPNGTCNDDLICLDDLCQVDTGAPQQGDLGGACYGNNTCNVGLVCVAGICEQGHSDVAGTDVGTDVGIPPDASDCEAGTGCFMDPCQENGDCISGICLLHMGGSVCSELCVDECAQGWSCRTVNTGSTDSLFACVSNASHLCLPCVDSSDCSANDVQNVCVDYGEAGKFCGAPCEDNIDCPLSYVCEEISTSQGGFSKQCIHQDGVCACSDYAVSMGLVTDCSVANEFGTCNGVRACTADGLADCNAPEPAPESCNGLDDDCDEAVDEDDPCNDDNPCTTDECTEFGCDHVPQGGAACDDENPNTKDDICAADGTCAGSEYECPTGDCIWSATPNGTDCDVEYKTQGALCDDGINTSKYDECDGAGVCAGEPYSCTPGPCEATSTPNGTDCDVDYWMSGYDCNDGDSTTKNDECDGAGVCAGESYSCTPTQCEQSSTPNGTDCTAVPKIAGIGCDDEDLTTNFDQCDGLGSCVGTPYSCPVATVCIPSYTSNGITCDSNYAPLDTPCDDDDVTTKEDSCDGLGECGGESYTCPVATACLSYTQNGVDCTPVYAGVGSNCDDGDPNTKNDTCDGTGSCLGVPIVCGDGVVDLGEECDDGNTSGGDCCGPTCLVEPSGTLCRASDGDCDPVETCDGVSASCPADALHAEGTVCRSQIGFCDVAETCSGTEAGCPADEMKAAGTVCRGSDGGCDPAEACDGVSVSCPADVLLAAGTVCRSQAGFCDVAESCSGTEAGCPADEFLPAGTGCDDGVPSNINDVCDAAGICAGVDALGIAGNPGLSCKAIIDAGASTGDGTYWVDPDGVGGSESFEVYCDMTTEDGGWTVIMKGNKLSETYPSGAVNTPSSGDHKLSDQQINALLAVADDQYNVRLDCGGELAYADIKEGWISNGSITTCVGSKYGTCTPQPCGGNYYCGFEIDTVSGKRIVSMKNGDLYGYNDSPCRVHGGWGDPIYYMTR